MKTLERNTEATDNSVEEKKLGFLERQKKRIRKFVLAAWREVAIRARKNETIDKLTRALRIRRAAKKSKQLREKAQETRWGRIATAGLGLGTGVALLTTAPPPANAQDAALAMFSKKSKSGRNMIVRSSTEGSGASGGQPPDSDPDPNPEQDEGETIEASSTAAEPPAAEKPKPKNGIHLRFLMPPGDNFEIDLEVEVADEGDLFSTEDHGGSNTDLPTGHIDLNDARLDLPINLGNIPVTITDAERIAQFRVDTEQLTPLEGAWSEAQNIVIKLADIGFDLTHIDDEDKRTYHVPREVTEVSVGDTIRKLFERFFFRPRISIGSGLKIKNKLKIRLNQEGTILALRMKTDWRWDVTDPLRKVELKAGIRQHLPMLEAYLRATAKLKVELNNGDTTSITTLGAMISKATTDNSHLFISASTNTNDEQVISAGWALHFGGGRAQTPPTTNTAQTSYGNRVAKRGSFDQLATKLVERGDDKLVAVSPDGEETPYEQTARRR